MSNQTVFYILGISLVSRPSSCPRSGCGFRHFRRTRACSRASSPCFLTLVAGTTAFAVLNARDEQHKQEAETAAESTSTESGTPPARPQLSRAGRDHHLGEVGNGPTVKISADPTGSSPSSRVGHRERRQHHHRLHQPVAGGPRRQGRGFEGKSARRNGPRDQWQRHGFGRPQGWTYTFYCDVPGHQQAGMEGQFIVK